MAAVGVVVQLLNMIFLVFEATTAGTSVLCSQFLGARQMDNVFRAIGVSLAFNMMMGRHRQRRPLFSGPNASCALWNCGLNSWATA